VIVASLKQLDVLISNGMTVAAAAARPGGKAVRHSLGTLSILDKSESE
jgi:hypothetical protein